MPFCKFEVVEEKLMRWLSVLACTLCIGFVGGCSDDVTELRISKTIAILKDTTRTIEQVTKTLTDAAAQAKKDGKPMPLDKIAAATEEAGKLKSNARELQNLKAAIEGAREIITKEQRDEYAARNKNSVQEALAELEAAQRALEVALNSADAAATGDPDARGAMEKLREKLKEGQDEFEVLTKRQT
jgi:hypothetical protein